MGRTSETSARHPQGPRKRSEARSAAVLVRMSDRQRERLTMEAQRRGLSMNEVVLEELVPLFTSRRAR